MNFNPKLAKLYTQESISKTRASFYGCALAFLKKKSLWESALEKPRKLQDFEDCLFEKAIQLDKLVLLSENERQKHALDLITELENALPVFKELWLCHCACGKYYDILTYYDVLHDCDGKQSEFEDFAHSLRNDCCQAVFDIPEEQRNFFSDILAKLPLKLTRDKYMDCVYASAKQNSFCGMDEQYCQTFLELFDPHHFLNKKPIFPEIAEPLAIMREIAVAKEIEQRVNEGLDIYDEIADDIEAFQLYQENISCIFGATLLLLLCLNDEAENILANDIVLRDTYAAARGISSSEDPLYAPLLERLSDACFDLREDNLNYNEEILAADFKTDSSEEEILALTHHTKCKIWFNFDIFDMFSNGAPFVYAELRENHTKLTDEAPRQAVNALKDLYAQLPVPLVKRLRPLLFKKIGFYSDIETFDKILFDTLSSLQTNAQKVAAEELVFHVFDEYGLSDEEE